MCVGAWRGREGEGEQKRGKESLKSIMATPVRTHKGKSIHMLMNAPKVEPQTITYEYLTGLQYWKDTDTLNAYEDLDETIDYCLLCSTEEKIDFLKCTEF